MSDAGRAAADRPVAVVLMAYGTPRTPADIEPYYTDIRRGRPPTAEQLADLTSRYAAIGGVSPLGEITDTQRVALQSALDEMSPDRCRVVLGMKHSDPKIEAAALAAATPGVDTIVGVVLAPHYSSASIGEYLQRLRSAVGDASDASDEGSGRRVPGVESWATMPAFVDFLAADLEARLAKMRADVDGDVRVVFTAHSLPQRVIDGGDPYVDQLRATATAVAGRLGLTEGRDWQIGWQSAGRTPEPWLGPDIAEIIDELAATDAVGGLVVCACGFVADHLEVLYDLDIDASRRAARHGLAFDRTTCVNDDPDVIRGLAELVLAASDGP